jgi:hypothetical protein
MRTPWFGRILTAPSTRVDQVHAAVAVKVRDHDSRPTRLVTLASQAEGRGFATRVPLVEIVEESDGCQNERGPAWTSLLRAVDRGDEVEARTLAVQMAHEVLSSPSIALAHEVLAGGPLATAKAVELAERLMKGDSSPLGCLEPPSSASHAQANGGNRWEYKLIVRGRPVINASTSSPFSSPNASDFTAGVHRAQTHLQCFEARGLAACCERQGPPCANLSERNPADSGLDRVRARSLGGRVARVSSGLDKLSWLERRTTKPRYAARSRWRGSRCCDRQPFQCQLPAGSRTSPS